MSSKMMYNASGVSTTSFTSMTQGCKEYPDQYLHDTDKEQRNVTTWLQLTCFGHLNVFTSAITLSGLFPFGPAVMPKRLFFTTFMAYFSLEVCKNKANYLLTPHSTVLLEKQLVKKFPAFYGTWTCITTFTSTRHLSLSWASPIQSIPLHPTPWKSILTLWRRSFFFLIFAHPVFKMLIIQEPNEIEIWNKRHFEEKIAEIMQHG
jgi:hypothetical protein